MRQHFCPKNPDGEGWYEGTVAQCEHLHGSNKPKNMRRAFRDRKAARAADQRAGVMGVDRGGYISGTDRGR